MKEIMKTVKFLHTKVLFALLIIVFGNYCIQAQIQMEGFYSEGEGGAAWDADGSGPEPYGNGHSTVNYYLASRDYVDPEYSSGVHFLAGMPGFETFEQALADNGFIAGQVTVRLELSSMGEDIMGVDWFNIGLTHYASWIPLTVHIDLNGELMIYGSTNYFIGIQGPGTGYDFHFESAFFTVQNVSSFSSDPVKAVAAAFMQDMEGMEMKINTQTEYAGVDLVGEGRSGAYYNMFSSFEKGLPEFPFEGLNVDHEGFAGWDADGTGPEPFGNGHSSQMYYGASLDYDDIDPDPNACLGHFLEDPNGFMNTVLQLQYRGYEIGDMKLKLGLNSLGPDKAGEDWGYENGNHWCNYYNNPIILELDGEPIIAMMQDTNKLIALPAGYWVSETGIGKVYDISSDASPDAQLVAQSFIRDVGTHYLKTITNHIQYVESFTGNGRNGGIWEISSGSLTGVHQQATFIPEGPVAGNWTLNGSPYYVDGNLSIETGQTLSISPGVKVAVRGPFQILVNGNIMAEGVADNNILFTHSNPNVRWDGFAYDGESGDTNALSVFDHCIFEHASAQGPDHENSGGVFAVKDHNKLEIYNSTFYDNMAEIEGGYPPSGGAIGLWNASPVIQNCIFRNNIAEYGGAVFVYQNSEPIISNCLFYANEAINGGALSYYEYGNGTFINNTIADNLAIKGGALHFYWQSNPEIINNILWGNIAEYGSQVYFPWIGPSSPGFYYNDIQGGIEGFYNGSNVDYLFNIDADPAFAGEGDHPYMIIDASPCRDMGTPDTSAWYYPQYLPENCLCGNPRFFGEKIDMGAYELGMIGISDPEPGELAVTVYPNPAKEVVNISFNLLKGSDVSISIFNGYGAMISRTDYGMMYPGEKMVNWNLSGLPEGIYYCRLQIGSESVTRKIVKIQ
jgi:hypothetical protein